VHSDCRTAQCSTQHTPSLFGESSCISCRHVIRITRLQSYAVIALTRLWFSKEEKVGERSRINYEDMAQHRYRQNKIKREHTIIEGILPILEGIAEHPHVQGITPGRINKRSSNRNATVTYQYKTDAGLKLLARSTSAVQEVFVVTDHPDQVLEDLTKRKLIKAPQRPKQGGTSQQKPGRANEHGRKTALRGQVGDRKAPPRRSKPENVAGATGDAPAKARDAAAAEAPADENASKSAGTSAGTSTSTPADAATDRPAKRPEVRDAIDQELQEQLMSMARQRAGAETPAPAKSKKKPKNVWQELVREHRALLALEEPPHDLDER